jgi:hypothetical protein
LQRIFAPAGLMELTALSRETPAGSPKSGFTKFLAVCRYCPIVTNARPFRAYVVMRVGNGAKMDSRASNNEQVNRIAAPAMMHKPLIRQRPPAATRHELIVPLISLSNSLNFNSFRHELMAHCFKILSHLESSIAGLFGQLSKTETFFRFFDEIFSIRHHRGEMGTIALVATVQTSKITHSGNVI